jgi:hypothetical protein
MIEPHLVMVRELGNPRMQPLERQAGKVRNRSSDAK